MRPNPAGSLLTDLPGTADLRERESESVPGRIPSVSKTSSHLSGSFLQFRFDRHGGFPSLSSPGPEGNMHVALWLGHSRKAGSFKETEPTAPSPPPPFPGTLPPSPPRLLLVARRPGSLQPWPCMSWEGSKNEH